MYCLSLLEQWLVFVIQGIVLQNSINSICQKDKFLIHIVIFYNCMPFRLIVDHAHKVAYCAVPKAGCSSWKTILANISSRGKVKPNMTLRELRGLHRNIDKYGLTKMQYNNKLSNYIKFMVVRHPMDRLLSAYRDKMRGRDVTYNHLANSVVKQFRQNKTNMEKFPTFLEFVRMVLSNVSLANEPHWSKYFYNCDPCQVKYDYVLKLETMQHDMDMLLSKVFQKEMQYVFVRKLNYFLASTKAEVTFPHRLGQYEALSKKQVFDLSRKFEHERDFFGYRFNQDSLEADCCDIQDSAGKQSQSNCCC